MTTSANCRANNPATCSYHGAVIRMDEAARTGDVNSYLQARFEAEQAKNNRSLKDRLSGEGKEELPPLLNPAEILRNKKAVAARTSTSVKQAQEQDKATRKREDALRARAEFLNRSAAIPTPMEAYALWLSVYESQQTKFAPHLIEQPYNTLRHVDERNTTTPGQLGRPSADLSHESLTWSRWTPTRDGGRVPEGYGSNALDVLILPDMVDVGVNPQNKDGGAGWEFGHSGVFVLERDDTTPSGLRASTNYPNRRIRTFPDVERYRRGRSFRAMQEELAAKGLNRLPQS